MAKPTKLQTNALCQWKMARIIVLLFLTGKPRLESISWYQYFSSTRCCFLGWDKESCPLPLPVSLISMLKILWPCCLNAVLGHPLPLLSCCPPCPQSVEACSGGSQLTWRCMSVSAACVLVVAASPKALPGLSPVAPMVATCSVLCLACMPEGFPKDLFKWALEILVNDDMLLKMEVWECLSFKNNPPLKSWLFVLWSCVGLSALMDFFGHLPSALLGAPPPVFSSVSPIFILFSGLRYRSVSLVSCSCIWNVTAVITKLSC